MFLQKVFTNPEMECKQDTAAQSQQYYCRVLIICKRIGGSFEKLKLVCWYFWPPYFNRGQVIIGNGFCKMIHGVNQEKWFQICFICHALQLGIEEGDYVTCIFLNVLLNCPFWIFG